MQQSVPISNFSIEPAEPITPNDCVLAPHVRHSSVIESDDINLKRQSYSQLNFDEIHFEELKTETMSIQEDTVNDKKKYTSHKWISARTALNRQEVDNWIEATKCLVYLSCTNTEHNITQYYR